MTIRDTIHALNQSWAEELLDRAGPSAAPNTAQPNPSGGNGGEPGALAHDGNGGGGRGALATTQPAPALEPDLARGPAASPGPLASLPRIMGAVNLAQAIRGYGHLAARLDPLAGAAWPTGPKGDPSLAPAWHALSENDLRYLPASLIGGPIAERSIHALEAIDNLRAVYCSRTGFDHEHIHDPAERGWLREAAESGRFRSPRALIDFKALLMRLTQVEVLERFLHRVFPGKSRFSIEGVDMLVPILDEVIGAAAETDIHNIVIGMAHRGRLNVLAHVLKKPYSQILAEFKDPVHVSWLQLEHGWTGDVKYHRGASRLMVGNEPVDLLITLAPNPSHLEAVNPVVEGMARAAATRVDQPGAPRFDPTACLPILIHGDAAFPGQGVVAETLNLAGLPAYHTGGTIHIITNNQLGFTTDPSQDRSTTYASDLAKGFEIPIIHVNADDPEACLEAALIAFAYRERFHKDFLIDLIGYRRHGHNEGDEPTYTQPLLYKQIEEHPTVRELWARELIERQVVAPEWPGELVEKTYAEWQRLLESLNAEEQLAEPALRATPRGAARRVKTAVPAARLRELNEGLARLPEGFTVNPKLARTLARRRTVLESPDEPGIDWALAESLAFASILADGISIRLTGQDAERGTFSHRHAVLHDFLTGAPFTPLAALPQARSSFEIANSPLSENAAIGFEFGCNVQDPGRLVIWEAQYGDFINGGQTMIDEFVTSARAKWGQVSSLVLLLPHGYEGQGPDHSSGRMERFLEQAADFNIRVSNCTSAAQYFHLLRRQAILLKSDPLPLIIMTPKSLLRHPQIQSTPRELTEGRWLPVIDDAEARQAAGEVSRLILCSGKITIDLITSEFAPQRQGVAVVRLEQLYPFPVEEMQTLLAGYPALKELVWVQEEPETMGAWLYVRSKLHELLDGRYPVHYVGRPRGSSPAEGSAAWHAVNQRALIEQAFNMKLDFSRNPVWLKKF